MAAQSDTYAKGMISKKEMNAKLKGTPDYVLEECYCKGVGEYRIDNALCVQLVAKAQLPTRYGTFTLYGFHDSREGKEHTAIVQGDVTDKERVPLRVHSECHTGDVWGSLRCDCRDQLEAATKYIAAQPFGVVIYLKQEGRGIGLLNKIKAYQLQDLGLDTIEANVYLGFSPDSRDYRAAAAMIRLMGIQSISLLTNNPEKIQGLKEAGIKISQRIPLVIPENPYNRRYLATKKNHMGHLI